MATPEMLQLFRNTPFGRDVESACRRPGRDARRRCGFEWLVGDEAS